ncbi:iron complex outermembrane recepter protein [Chitinophaga costaii]|uniref:Iron complex outermembrane recepter protein n=1 Tax=Chitinophaga costaii TaxID=1335309 RepID=A0A1C4EJQ0_9BACT|nr:carboxypeptidase regulatory-like domain-containing protein [Chitinophaga costaii]PUZ23775.1 carboxypeptidase-like regulatory domain-containing protein [Chitinophaga costaii]SCC43787.1 iron complex outermembrane recepter protein [Chitinophaga costaii]
MTCSVLNKPKSLLLLLFTCLSLTITFAQQTPTGTLTGTVNLPNGQPAVAITVSIPSLNRGTVTNEEGRYALEQLAPGNYLLRLSGVGVQQTERHITIRAGRTSSLNAHLEAQTGQLKEVAITKSKSRYKV